MSENNAGCQLAARYGAYDDYDDDYYKLRSIHSTTRHYIYCYAYALPNSNNNNMRENKERKRKRGQRPLRQTFEFMHFECEVKSSILYIECILQMDLNAQVREDVIDGYRLGIRRTKDGK